MAGDTGWDLNGPTAIFSDLANSFERNRICILGCGRGYDAIMFAKKGFDVTAVDFSPSAIIFLEELKSQEKVNINILQKNIFSLAPTYNNSFDYIIEQTCFCAIHPSRRNEYEQLANQLLVPNGKLVGLWFPLDKTFEDGGPPWGTTINDVKSIFNKNWSVFHEEFPALSIKPRRGREKLIIFQKIKS